MRVYDEIIWKGSTSTTLRHASLRRDDMEGIYVYDVTTCESTTRLCEKGKRLRRNDMQVYDEMMWNTTLRHASLRRDDVEGVNVYDVMTC